MGRGCNRAARSDGRLGQVAGRRGGLGAGPCGALGDGVLFPRASAMRPGRCIRGRSRALATVPSPKRPTGTLFLRKRSTFQTKDHPMNSQCRGQESTPDACLLAHDDHRARSSNKLGAYDFVSCGEAGGPASMRQKVPEAPTLVELQTLWARVGPKFRTTDAGRPRKSGPDAMPRGWRWTSADTPRKPPHPLPQPAMRRHDSRNLAARCRKTGQDLGKCQRSDPGRPPFRALEAGAKARHSSTLKAETR